jgi:hypothetical protein
MARKSKRLPLPKEAQWVQLINAFRQEPAWKALSPAARVVYVELKGVYNGSNNGSIMGAVRWLAGKAGLSKNTVDRALKELEAHGFIVAVRRGCVGFEGKGEATLWRLTELGYAGERPTQDYKSWLPENKTLSPKRGRRVPEMGTASDTGVPEMGTGRPQYGDGRGRNPRRGRPHFGDNLQYAKGGGEPEAG